MTVRVNQKYRQFLTHVRSELTQHDDTDERQRHRKSREGGEELQVSLTKEVRSRRLRDSRSSNLDCDELGQSAVQS